ncbi:hypothetical protein [Dactylosporangium sp. CS-033363]|uniref:hypothetical protein n=1 Tax=Dactylosporangium sp. CS-033363 TaxID=3239935 RepID=UPI003D91436B
MPGNAMTAPDDHTGGFCRARAVDVTTTPRPRHRTVVFRHSAPGDRVTRAALRAAAIAELQRRNRGGTWLVHDLDWLEDPHTTNPADQ